MKNLFFILIASLALTSCSKNIVKDVTVSVTENGQYFGQPAFAINADYAVDNFGENTKPFAVEITVTATPVTNVSSEGEWLVSVTQPTLTKIVTLTNNDFRACQGGMTHGLGYHFDSQENVEGAYTLSYTKRML